MVGKISSMRKSASVKHLHITFSRREGMQNDMQWWLEIENNTHTQSRHIVHMCRLDVNSKYSLHRSDANMSLICSPLLPSLHLIKDLIASNWQKNKPKSIDYRLIITDFTDHDKPYPWGRFCLHSESTKFCHHARCLMAQTNDAHRGSFGQHLLLSTSPTAACPLAWRCIYWCHGFQFAKLSNIRTTRHTPDSAASYNYCQVL